MKRASSEVFKGESLRGLVYFPLLFNAVGLLVMGLLYTLSPSTVVGSTEFSFVMFLLAVVMDWGLLFVVVRRFRKQGIVLKKLIMPAKEFRWIPAILVFFSLNVLFAVYILYPLIPIPPMRGLSVFQLLSFLS